MPTPEFSRARRIAVLDEVLTRLRATPGVTHAAATNIFRSSISNPARPTCRRRVRAIWPTRHVAHCKLTTSPRSACGCCAGATSRRPIPSRHAGGVVNQTFAAATSMAAIRWRRAAARLEPGPATERSEWWTTCGSVGFDPHTGNLACYCQIREG
jgi:hypothetical protein